MYKYNMSFLKGFLPVFVFLNHANLHFNLFSLISMLEKVDMSLLSCFMASYLCVRDENNMRILKACPLQPYKEKLCASILILASNLV